MNPEQFKQKWTAVEDNLNPLPQDKLRALNLPEASVAFLGQSGLPEDAAPFLSFCDASDDPLQGIGRLTALHSFLPEEFDHYIIIGSCNEGDPVVINTATGQVEYLDHEDNFTARLFNASLENLADCLLVYRDFVLKIQEEHGEDAYLNAAYTEDKLLALKEALTQADPEVMQRQGYWYEEFETEKAMWEESDH